MGDVTPRQRSKTVSSESVKQLHMQDLIDELPEPLLIEILCRLPRETIIQCKGVSKSWSTLISQPCFYKFHLRLQKQNPALESSLMFVRTDYTAEHRTYFFTISKQTWHWEKLIVHQRFKVVAGTCNDLVLCCLTPIFQRSYYICNPYTKQWVSLPPTPQCHQEYVHVGFLCDSYHRCKVVRILECEVEPAFQFKVEFFSSESCEWSVVACPQGLTYDDIRSSVDRVAIACNGRLYWLGHGGFIIYLDPSEFDSSCIHSTTAATSPANHCGFIPKPSDVDLSGYSSCEQCLSVCRGRLSLCQIYKASTSTVVYAWELKEDDHEVDGTGGSKMVKWCLKKKVVLRRLFSQFYWMPLAFDPNDEDILYARGRFSGGDYICKLPLGKFKEAFEICFLKLSLQNRIDALPLVIPWLRLPTPAPRLEYHNKICRALRFQEKLDVQVGQRGIGIVPYSPLGRGFFAGKAVVESLDPNVHVHAAAHPRLTGENLEKNRHIYHAIERLATKNHCSPAQLALSWVLHQGDDVVPIPGVFFGVSPATTIAVAV